jgi:hypothetical protein
MRPHPITIGGFYRSGTSLLRRILDSHSRIHCGPEVKFTRDFFGDYPHDPLDALTSLQEIGFPKTVPMSLADRASLYARFREAGARQLRDWPASSVGRGLRQSVTSIAAFRTRSAHARHCDGP